MRISDWSSDVCSSDLLYRLAEDRIGERQVERQERLGRPRLVEALPLDALVDDLFRQVQGEVVEGQRSQHEQQDGDLLGPAVSPDVLEDIRFHASSWTGRSGRSGSPAARQRRTLRFADRKSTRLNSSH